MTRAARAVRVLAGLCFPVLVAVALGRRPVSAQTAAPAEEEDATELAKKVQNLVADLITVPCQNNLSFGRWARWSA